MKSAARASPHQLPEAIGVGALNPRLGVVGFINVGCVRG
jgi:hypothetical protein